MKLEKKTRNTIIGSAIAVVLVVVLVVFAVNFNSKKDVISNIGTSSTLKMTSMGPISTEPGEKFQVQPSGESAMWVKGENITKNTVIVWQTITLPSTVSNTNFVTAIVPQELYAKPGKYGIYLLDTKTNETSNKLEFTVEKRLALKLIQMGPTSTKVNQGFQVQPNGESALWVKGEGFTQNTKIMWGETTLPTSFAKLTLLTARVPKSLYAQPGEFKISLIDTKTKFRSNSLTFTVQ